MNTNTFSQFFRIIIIFFKDLVMLFCHENTVDVCYNQQVDHTMYPIVHNNHWFNLTLYRNSNYVLVDFN